MSDSPQGPGWWQASDGKWYPPESAPGGGAGSGGKAGTLDLGAALSFGWNKFVQYIGTIILIVLIIFAVTIVFNGISQVIQGSVDGLFGKLFLGGIFFAVGVFISFMLQAGLIRAALAVTRGETPEVGMLFQTTNLAPFAIGAILVALLSFVGFLVCCIGYVVVALFTLFWGYYVIDRGTQPVDAIKASFSLVSANFGAVVLFAIVVVVLNIITCGLAIGVTAIATAYAYKSLNGEPIAA